MSIRDIAGQIGLHDVTVRYHINRLAGEGLVESKEVRRGRGRPSVLYGLSRAGQRSFPSLGSELAVEILAILQATRGQAEVRRVLSARTDGLRAYYASRFAGLPFAERVAEMVRVYEERGGLPEYEVTESGVLLRVHNCALSGVAPVFPVVCECELGFLESLLDAEVTRVAHHLNGDPACTYVIRPRE